MTEHRAKCGRCDGDMPRGWFFVQLCDPCLDAANEERQAARVAAEAEESSK